MRLGFAEGGFVHHPTLGDARYSVQELPPSADDQVHQTIDVMRSRVKQDAMRPEFQQWAASICGNPAYSEMDAMAKAYEHVRRAIHFQRDEVTGAGVGGHPESEVIEVIIRPMDMARYVSQGVAIGDCDDFSSYLACLLSCYGIPTAFVTVAADGRAPDHYSHVYVAAYPLNEETGKRERVALDASHGQYPGWEVPNQYGKICEWPVNGPNLFNLTLAVAAGIFAWKYFQKELAA